MVHKRNFSIILSFVIILALAIQITRLNGYMKNKKNENIIDIDTYAYEHINKELISKADLEKYTIVYDENYVGLSEIKDNVVKTLEYMGKDCETYKASDYKKVNKQSSNIILILEDLDVIKPFNEILQFVMNGGNIFFANRLAPTGTFKSAAVKLGIIEYGNFKDFNGINLVDNLIINSKGIKVKDGQFIQNSSVELQLDSKCRIYALSNEEGKLLWSKKLGQGEIFYFNGTMLSDKNNRGVIGSVISLMGEDIIYPIINTKQLYIDDFPAPMPRGTTDAILNQYGRDIWSFYKEIWWPDMVRIAAKNNIKYTGLVIGNYDDDNKDLNIDNILLADSDFNYYAKELLGNGGELGIHGYNHQPLTTEPLKDSNLGYKRWESKEKITEGINILQNYVNSKLGNYSMAVYVPPSNIITDEGIEALQESITNFKILASLYDNGSNDEGAEEDSYVQEIGIDERKIINLPRITSGYSNDEKVMWKAVNSIATYGYFSHFIHPDDVMDNNRSGGMSWAELSKEFEGFISDINYRYKWLNDATASEGANEVIKYVSTKPYFEKSKNHINIYCDKFMGEQYFILRSDNNITSTKNCSVERIDEDAYLVKVIKAISKIEFQGDK